MIKASRSSLRAPFSQQRLSVLPDGRVRYELPRPWPTAAGVTELIMEPLHFLKRLAALLPAHQTDLLGGELDQADPTAEPLGASPSPSPSPSGPLCPERLHCQLSDRHDGCTPLRASPQTTPSGSCPTSDEGRAVSSQPRRNPKISRNAPTAARTTHLDPSVLGPDTLANGQKSGMVRFTDPAPELYDGPHGSAQQVGEEARDKGGHHQNDQRQRDDPQGRVRIKGLNVGDSVPGHSAHSSRRPAVRAATRRWVFMVRRWCTTLPPDVR